MAIKIYATDYRYSGKLTVEGTTASTSPTTGALVVGGGVGSDGQVSAQAFKAFGASAGYELTIALDGTGAKIGHNSGARDIQFQTSSTTRLTIAATGPVTVAQELRVAGDVGGAANQNTLTGTSNLTANSTGVGTIKFKGTTSRDSAGFIKMYAGTTAYYVPVFSGIAG
ncbi:hypothetical protein ASE61_07305 [Bosea sp. Root670]|uniref:hypothetical protein n=1 Tax=Bosea sp. Root670 TaxID=1736583 RepID=UPI00071390DA|nr:hypothetical protein [Bosea sp. Root670]KRE04717.1 hypothetical protein ASE61_07305 [Bosea sp. Root670]